MADADSKACRVCGLSLPLSSFYTGQSACKRCHTAAGRARYEATKPPPSTHANCIACGARFQKTVPNASRERHCSVECRFWSKVDQSGGADACWSWTASTKTARCGMKYGDFNYKGKSTGAHRVAWELTNGQIPDGLCVLHKCDNPLCCNPAHHFLGTRTDNVNDMLAKGRGGRMSADGLARFRTAMVGKKRPEHVVEAVRQALLGRKQSPEEIAKRSASLKGIVRTDEWRQHLREAWVLRRARAASEKSAPSV